MTSAAPSPPALNRGAIGRSDVLTLQRTIGNRRTGDVLLQRVTLEDLRSRGARMREMAKTAPDKGVNLWQATHDSGGSVHLLGTHHKHALGDVGDKAMRQYLVEFLMSGRFTDVYTEMKEDVFSAEFNANLLDEVEAYAQKVRALEQAEQGNNRIAIYRARQAVSDAKGTPLGKFASLGTDTAYLSLAASRGTPRIGAFETGDTKAAARRQNVEDMQIPEDDPERRLYDPDADASGPDPGFLAGDQRKLFTEVADELEAGKDILSAEERNRQFMEIFKRDLAQARQVRQLWIVGASHLPGLILRFQDLGWTVKHEDPPPPQTRASEEREPETSAVGAASGTSVTDVD